MPLYVEAPDAPLTEAELAVLATDRQLSAHPTLAAARDKFLATRHGSDGSAAAAPPADRPALWLLQGEAACVDASGGAASPGGGAEDADGFLFVTAADAAAAAAAAAATSSGAASAAAAARTPSYVGSTDATTCVVAALWCPCARLLWLGHLDAPPSPAVASRWAGLVAAGRGRGRRRMASPELYLIGGYAGAPKRDQGPSLARAVLAAFHALDAPIRLALCCVGAANTGADNGGGSGGGGGGGGGAPLATSLCFDLAAGGVPRAWAFAQGARGPEVARRFAAQHVREHPSQLAEVWDADARALRLPAFDASLHGGWGEFFMARLAVLEDAPLLESFSTSPAHEAAHFPDDMRAMAAWLTAAQRRGSRERAAAARSVRYEWRGRGGGDDGSGGGGGGGGGAWVRVEEASEGANGAGGASSGEPVQEDGGGAAAAPTAVATTAAGAKTVACT